MELSLSEDPKALVECLIALSFLNEEEKFSEGVFCEPWMAEAGRAGGPTRLKRVFPLHSKNLVQSKGSVKVPSLLTRRKSGRLYIRSSASHTRKSENL